MSRFIVLLITATQLSACASTAEPSYPTNTPLPGGTTVQAGGFSIWMPAEPDPDRPPEEIAIGGTTVSCPELFARTNGVYWIARYCDIFPYASLTETRMLDDAQSFLLEEAQARLTSTEDLTMDGALARRIAADSALRAGEFDGKYLALLVFRHGRLFLISTYGFNGAEPSDLATMEQFISSFQFLQQTAAA